MDEYPDLDVDTIASITLGKFVAEFEWICHGIRECIKYILVSQGLKEPDLMDLILANEAFAARALLSTLQSLTERCGAGDLVGRKEKTWGRSFEDLINTRNDLLHGTHYYGPNSWSPTSLSGDIYIARNKQATGGLTAKATSSLTELQAHLNRAIDLRNEFQLLSKQINMRMYHILAAEEAVRRGEITLAEVGASARPIVERKIANTPT